MYIIWKICQPQIFYIWNLTDVFDTHTTLIHILKVVWMVVNENKTKFVKADEKKRNLNFATWLDNPMP